MIQSHVPELSQGCYEYWFMSHNCIEIIYKQFGSKAKTGKVFVVKLHDKQYPKDKLMIHKRPSTKEYIYLTTDLVPCISWDY